MPTNSDRIQRMSVYEAGSAATAQEIFDIGDNSRKLSHGNKSLPHKSVDYHFSANSQTMALPYRPLLDSGNAVATEKYRPFAVDWRFLPDEALFVKDYIRHRLANISNSMANSPKFRQIWVKSFGRSALKLVQSAGTLFIHIPKTGGTSVSKVLYGRNLPPYSARFWFEIFGPTVQNLRSFSIFRHPIDRVVSIYKMALAGGTDIMAYSQFSRHNLKGLESLDSFIDNIAKQKSEGILLPLELQDQSVLVLSEQREILVDRLFSLDRKRGFPNELSRWLSVEQLPHLNATNPISVVVSKETKRKILNIYARDLEIYEMLSSKGGFADLKGVRFSE